MRKLDVRVYCLLLLTPAIGFMGLTRVAGIGHRERTLQTLSKVKLSGLAALGSLTGRWVLPLTGDDVQVDAVSAGMRVGINGIEWPVAPAGVSLSGTRVLSAEDARRLFPEIGDAPLFLADKEARLEIELRTGYPDEMVLTLSIQAERPGGRGSHRVQLLTGTLTRPGDSGPTRLAAPSLGLGWRIRPLAQSAPAVTVKPSVAPNLFGSPSFASYTANALSALQTGLSSMGNPAVNPAGYAQTNQVGDRSNIASTLNSWLGMSNPGTVFGAAFANEVGNRVHFGFHILGNGTQFELNNIQFHLHGTDSGDIFALDGSFNGASYSSTRVGINYGPDRTKGTPDDVMISSGPGTQLVDELVYVGIGNAIAPEDLACVGSSQAMLDCVKSRYDQLIPFALTATYDVFDDSAVLLASGSGTVNFGSCLSITCPSNIVAKVASGKTSATVAFPAPVAIDSCGEPVQVVSVPASGSQFPVGVTTVVCTATDMSGSTASCSFTVEVGDAVLQDVHTGDCLLFDSKTGDYIFTHCGPGGFTLTGKGSVRTIGATISLTDSKPGRSVSASFLSNQLTGTAKVTVQLSAGVSQTYTISSTKPNPSCVCAA